MSVFPMTEEQFVDWIEAHPWKFAKTMPQIPHFYTLRYTARDADEFESAVQFIRDNGYTGRFGRTDYRYYDVNGWKYWTMGAPIKETILVNRAEKP